MSKYRRIKNKRPKAIFGIDGAIQASAQLAATGLQIASDVKLAKEQAKTMKDTAQMQVDAVQQQTENDRELFDRQVDLTKQENQKMMDRMTDISMTNQTLAAKQNDRQLRANNALQVKHGGSMRRKLRNLWNPESSLRGRFDNLPFNVTDGGGVIPIGVTPEGYDLYEIYGNDHEHYHKAQGGNKTGVGIKFAGGKTIEGEGNQNSNKGELLLVTPDDAKFISKHTIKGFNPADAVRAGMHPMEAFNTQEEIKNMYNIPDDGNGNTNTPVKKNGGHFRTRAYNGLPYRAPGTSFTNDYGGVMINGLGNTLGAGAATLGNLYSSRIMQKGYNDAANAMISGLRNIRGIDESVISRDDYRAPKTFVPIQTPTVNTNVEQAAAERSLQRNLDRINRGSLSSAAGLSRSAIAETNYNDYLGNVAAQARKEGQSIINANLGRIAENDERNATRQAAADQAYLSAKLDVAKYNNQLENGTIAQIAGIEGDRLANIANTRAGAALAIANSVGNLFKGTAADIKGAYDRVNDFRTEAVMNSADMDNIDRDRFLSSLSIRLPRRNKTNRTTITQISDMLKSLRAIRGFNPAKSNPFNYNYTLR